MPKLCEYENCRKRASYGKYYGKPLRCKEHKEDYKPQYMVCKCGKSTGPCFNYENELRAICCSQCKEEGMINIKTKKCRCKKSIPCFNYENEMKAICCSQCKEEGMIDIKNKKCKCGKSTGPCFNYENEIEGIYCSQCKEEGMIDIKSKKCKCGKSTGPCFNYKNEIKHICCNKCKKEGMIDIKNKKCKCGRTIPCFNYENELVPLFCSQCKEEGVINIKDRRCRCRKSRPCFNYENEDKAICCSQCKEEGMINIISKKCRCGKSIPCFNFKNEPKAICCSQCKEKGMVDIKHDRCPNCIDWVDSQRGNRKYKRYCARCYAYLFPTDPLTLQIRVKMKETIVQSFINLHYSGFIHDQPLWVQGCDCTHKRRIDHRKLIGYTLLCIETDVFQHMSYDKQDEMNRYHDCYMALSGKMIFIRFNPDKYIDKKGKRRNPSMSTRLNVLKNEIDKQIKRIENEENEDLLEIIKLYYDGYN